MVNFPKLDLKNGLFIQNLDNPVEGYLMEWGVPTCMIELGKDVLSLLPGDTLGGFALGIQEGKEAAQNNIADAMAWAFRDLGIMEIDADTGKLKFLSSSSRYGIDAKWAEYAGFAFGVADALNDLYGDAQETIDNISKCLDDTEAWFRLVDGDETGSAQLVLDGGPGEGGDPNDPTDPANQSPFQKNRQGEFLIMKQQVQTAINFSNKCTSSLNLIAEVLAEREIEAAKVAEEEEARPIFRLVFGPPAAKKGQFLLSRDGLYYDSQNRTYADGSPLPTSADLGIVIPGDKWGLDYDPNLGGKGTVIALSELGKYVDTFFDVNQVNNTPSMDVHYTEDHFLQVLESQKNKEIYDLSSHVNSLVASGYDSKSALVVNFQQSIFAAIDRHTHRINKRKKQIEVGVLANQMFGSDQTFSPGSVPLNDFSYLSGINLDIDIKKQRDLTFEEGEVEGIVLPIRPKFVRSARAEAQTLLPPMIIPPIGAGGIISLGDFSSTDSPVLSLTDNIVTDYLFAIYNFLNSDIVGTASNDYKVLNCVNNSANNAQLVASDAGDVFDKGLGLAKLKGITRQQYKDSEVYISALGSFVKLPDSTDFQNLLYNQRGATIDAWVHIPQYGTSFSGAEVYEDATLTTVDTDSGDWADYNYYKLLLACENTGGTLVANADNMPLEDNSTKATKGFIMGFSRDPQIYSETRVTPGSDTDPGSSIGVAAKDTAGSSCFFLATTQSLNTTDVEFVSVSSISRGLRYSKMTVDASTTVNNVKFNDVSAGFIHINVSFDPNIDEVRIHLDGNLMTTSSISEVFGVAKNTMPRIPTFITPADATTSSFYYYQNLDGNTVEQLGTSAFNTGPNNYNNTITGSLYTPWIVGGGWTDGMKITNSSGGFMSERHGYRSALDGYVGSLKFYSKALTTKEVITNYKAQKDFFKNIKL